MIDHRTVARKIHIHCIDIVLRNIDLKRVFIDTTTIHTHNVICMYKRIAR